MGTDAEGDEYILALAKRLQEYDADRKKWRTLWHFLPRLMAVFPEKAGLKADMPALFPIKTMKDLLAAPRAATR